MRRLRAACLAALLVSSPLAWSCGYCAEDKVAANYDHAVVSRALAKGEVVVFAEVSGRGSTPSLVKAARRAAARVPGVDPGSVRVTDAPATISFAMKGNGSPEAALAAAERGAAGDLKLTILMVMR